MWITAAAVLTWVSAEVVIAEPIEDLVTVAVSSEGGVIVRVERGPVLAGDGLRRVRHLTTIILALSLR